MGILVIGQAICFPTGMLQSTFTQKFLMMIFAGFCAACLFWMFRHFIEEALWESSDAGYKQSLHGKTMQSQ